MNDFLQPVVKLSSFFSVKFGSRPFEQAIGFRILEADVIDSSVLNSAGMP
jgi:hypothetical protein